MKLKSSTLKQQRENAQLELIIEEFTRGMRSAHKPYIAQGPKQYCCHSAPRFTISLEIAWNKYIEFCQSHPNE